jgi:hypothetical protein
VVVLRIAARLEPDMAPTVAIIGILLRVSRARDSLNTFLNMHHDSRPLPTRVTTLLIPRSRTEAIQHKMLSDAVRGIARAATLSTNECIGSRDRVTR